MFYDDALYESMLYLLTHLLTYFLMFIAWYTGVPMSKNRHKRSNAASLRSMGRKKKE